MPGRKTPIITGELYHIYNRGVAKLPTFTAQGEFKRFIDTINYYRYSNTPKKYSDLLLLGNQQQKQIIDELQKRDQQRVIIHAFVLMRNHFHLILEQKSDNGISGFMSDIANSYTKYANTLQDRVGPFFQGRFKSVIINTREQLLHLSRYIHLNPYTDQVVTTAQELMVYPYSSLPIYIGDQENGFVDTSFVLGEFKRKGAYKRFVLSQRGYQKRLGSIKRLLHENPSHF